MFDEGKAVVGHVAGAFAGVASAMSLAMTQHRINQVIRASTAADCRAARAGVRARAATSSVIQLQAELVDALDDADDLEERLAQMAQTIAELRADREVLADALMKRARPA